jgi:ribosomal protein S26
MKGMIKYTSCTNEVQRKKAIVDLWVKKMVESQYLKNLVESMPKGPKQGRTTK